MLGMFSTLNGSLLNSFRVVHEKQLYSTLQILQTKPRRAFTTEWAESQKGIPTKVKIWEPPKSALEEKASCLFIGCRVHEPQKSRL